ncbi:MAG: hypothetical protein HY394_04460 [Candidatus Diapherotrites archaeon]|nr:hypothetical protein [Candidatus Diapherotrites archaeon]
MAGQTKKIAVLVFATVLFASAAFAQTTEIKRSQIVVAGILPGCADRYRGAPQANDGELYLSFCLGSHPDGGKGGIDIGVYGTWTPKVNVKGFDLGLDTHYRDPRILTTFKQAPAPTLSGSNAPMERFAWLEMGDDVGVIASRLKAQMDPVTGRIPYPTSAGPKYVQTTRSAPFSFISPDYPNDTIVLTVRILAANYRAGTAGLGETLIANIEYVRYGTKDGAAKAMVDAGLGGTAPAPSPGPAPGPSPSPGPAPSAPPANSFLVLLPSLEAPGKTITSATLFLVQNSNGTRARTKVAEYPGSLTPELQGGVVARYTASGLPKGYFWRYYSARAWTGYFELETLYDGGGGFWVSFECTKSGTSGSCQGKSSGWI